MRRSVHLSKGERLMSNRAEVKLERVRSSFYGAAVWVVYLCLASKAKPDRQPRHLPSALARRYGTVRLEGFLEASGSPPGACKCTTVY